MFRQIHLSHLLQTLTTLDLGGNQMTDQAAQYLSQGLRNNTVRSQ